MKNKSSPPQKVPNDFSFGNGRSLSSSKKNQIEQGEIKRKSLENVKVKHSTESNAASRSWSALCQVPRGGFHPSTERDRIRLIPTPHPSTGFEGHGDTAKHLSTHVLVGSRDPPQKKTRDMSEQQNFIILRWRLGPRDPGGKGSHWGCRAARVPG